MPLPKPDVRLSPHPAFHCVCLRLAVSMLSMMAIPTQGFQVWHLMRLGAFDVMHSEVLRVSTSHTLVVIAHLDSELPFRHFEGLVATAFARGAYGVCVDSLIGSSRAPREVCVIQCLLKEVGMR